MPEQETEVSGARVLVADDEEDMRWTLSTLMGKEGLQALEAENGEKALSILRRENVDAGLVDLRMPGMGGMAFLKEAMKIDPRLPVVIVTAFGSIGSAVEAMKLGAFDYVTKPFDGETVREVMRRAVQKRQDQPDDLSSPSTGSSAQPWEHLGASLPMREITSEVELVASTDYTVVITGETGTGKEVVARAIHETSPRADGPFVPVDCGSIAPTLIESELFGHEKGSFTGAVRSRPGKFEVASGGTLFLDEISSLPLDLQPKLLRALQEKTIVIVRVGSNQRIEVDTRMIVATNRSLSAMVENGNFRRDLYYRLNEFNIDVPPLRERREDIVFLAKKFLDQSKSELGRDVEGITEDGLERLLSYEWPGNVRELRNVIRRAALRCDTRITGEDLNLSSGPHSPGTTGVDIRGRFKGQTSLKELLKSVKERVERQVITQALKQAEGNKAEVARMLDVDYKTVHTKVKEYGISLQNDRNGRNADD